jgi:ADP-ribose pyrophosphatase
MYEVLESEMMYRGKVFAVRRDQVRTPSGRVTQIDIVEHGGAVCLIPIDADDNIWLIRQYRHAVGQDILELPAGQLEESETPEACARRECQEEIGMFPERLDYLGSAYLAPGYSSELMHFYLASQLRPSTLPKDPDEVIQVEVHPRNAIWPMIPNSGNLDVKSIAGLSLLEACLQKNPL